MEAQVSIVTIEADTRERQPPLTPKCRRGKTFRSGPGATRTRDLLLRRQALYPAELRTRGSGRGKLARSHGFRNRPTAGLACPGSVSRGSHRPQ
jgi:hypothetical protein